MFAYLALTTPIAAMAIASPLHKRFPIIWGLAFFALVIFVGLRHHVGMDWNNYLIMIERANSGEFTDALLVAEPGYALLLWIAGQNGWGVYGAYLIGTIIFSLGLFRYAKSTPSPWIALLVAMPFLVIVVSMSAARQAVAIGVLLWLAAGWSQASLLKRTSLILLAACFHASAIGFLIFAFIGMRIPFWTKVVGSSLMAVAMVYLLEASGRANYYDSLYASGQTAVTHSSGAIFHVMLNGGPALACFALGQRARQILIPDDFHRQMAVLAIMLIPAAFIMSAASGRLTLYLFPVSMWFFSALPLMMRNPNIRLATKMGIGVFFVGLLAFWLSAGNAASAHANYRNFLWVPAHELVLCCK